MASNDTTESLTQADTRTVYVRTTPNSSIYHLTNECPYLQRATGTRPLPRSVIPNHRVCKHCDPDYVVPNHPGVHFPIDTSSTLCGCGHRAQGTCNWCTRFGEIHDHPRNKPVESQESDQSESDLV